MADDKMKNDDRQRNMGTGGREGQDFGQGGQQSPGRNPQDRQQGGGQQQGGQKKGNLNIDDEDELGGGGQRGGQSDQSRGGQNR